METFTLSLEKEGQIKVPLTIQQQFNLKAGDTLTLIRINDVVFFTSKQPKVSQLADKFAELCQVEGVNLDDLLEGLAQEREAIWRENND